MDPTPSPPIRVLRMPELRARLGISRSLIYLKLNGRSKYFDADFPHPMKLGRSAVGWRDCDVDAWIQLQQVRSARNA